MGHVRMLKVNILTKIKEITNFRAENMYIHLTTPYMNDPDFDEEKNICLTRDYFARLADRIKYFSGVESWFERINPYVSLDFI